VNQYDTKGSFQMHFRPIAVLLCGLLLSVGAVAQPTRVRGTIAGLDGSVLSVTSRDGEKLSIKLGDPLTVSALRRADLRAVTPGTYVGIASRPLPGGGANAIEVLVFPEAMRGAGEGHYAWDLEPGSMMTNGTVTGTVTAAAGQDLTVKAKDSDNAIHVPPGVPVVTFAPASRDDLKPGARVFLTATRGADGQLGAARVTVGKDGVDPPM
jgi:hypothetical protein